jgi:hypothetical protein
LIHLKNTRRFTIAIAVGLLAFPGSGKADTSFTINNTTADAFLAAGSTNNPVGSDLTSLNFGGAGTLAIAPAGSTKGEFDSVIRFNTAAAISQFNSTYGAGNWQITGFNLQLASNFATQGSQPNNNIFNTINAGNFGINWLSNDSWTEGNGGGMGTPGFPGNSLVSFDSIPSLLAPGYDALGIYTYTPPGNAGYRNYSLPLDAGLVSDAAAGGDVSLYFYAAPGSQVGYLFNSKEFGSNHPELTIIAAAVPEPGTVVLTIAALAALLPARKRVDKR